jgi:hypothetical protein
VLSNSTGKTCKSEIEGNADWPLTDSDTDASGTCVEGYEGNPRRTCQLSGIWSLQVDFPCEQKTCAAETTVSVNWPTTFAGEGSVGECAPGYELDPLGAPSRACLISGNWSDTISRPCPQTICPPLPDDGNANWLAALSGDLANGTCKEGWSGNPYRLCLLTGAWGDIENDCTQNTCPQETFANATWRLALSGETGVVGSCSAGFDGTSTRSCGLNGDWSGVSNPCIQLSCDEEDRRDDDNYLAIFPKTPATQIAIGTCRSGRNGFPQRQCFANGTWADTVLENPCSENTCPALNNDNNANWDIGVPESVTTGTCVLGYFGSPQRLCTGGGWESPTVFCQRYTCPAINVSRALFPQASSGDMDIIGICEPGWSGTPERNCNLTGTWIDVPSDPCTQIFCGMQTDASFSWPRTAAGEVANGTCAPGLEGFPRRECSFTGNWLAPIGTCIQALCPPLDDSAARWPATATNTANVTGTCNAGFDRLAADISPTRNCLADKEWGEVTNQCVARLCPESTSGNAGYLPTPAGNTALGSCLPGFTSGGTPINRLCQLSGVWAAPTASCTQLRCQADNTDFDASWPEGTPAGTFNVTGVCRAGFSGAPTRDCLLNGAWSGTIGGFNCTQFVCPARSEAFADWPATGAGATPVTVTLNSCQPTYTIIPGLNPTRQCFSNGTWGPVTNTCQPAFCPLLSANGNAAWPSTRAGQTGQGTCLTGFEGNPTRMCSPDGAWGDISGPCLRTLSCPAVRFQNTDWEDTRADATATGSCLPGYRQADNVAPTRTCQRLGEETAAWSTEVINKCELDVGRTTDLITAVQVAGNTDNSIILQWETAGSPLPNAFRIQRSVTGDEETFADLDTGLVFNATSAEVAGLGIEYGIYYFRIYASNTIGESGRPVFSEDFATVSGRTRVRAPHTVSLGTISRDTIQISWQKGSDLTSFFVVSVKRDGDDTRDFGTSFIQVQNSTSTTYTATNLSPATFYTFRIEAGLASGELNNELEVSYRTDSSAGDFGGRQSIRSVHC